MFDVYAHFFFIIPGVFYSFFVFSHSLCNLYPGNTYLTFLNCLKDSDSLFVFSHSLCNLYPGNTYLTFLNCLKDSDSLFVFSHSLCNLYPGNTPLTFLNCLKDSEIFSLLCIFIKKKRKKKLCANYKKVGSVHGAVNYRSSWAGPFHYAGTFLFFFLQNILSWN